MFIHCSPKASGIVGSYDCSESPQGTDVESPRSVKGSGDQRDYFDEDPMLFSPALTPGVTGRNVVVRDSDFRVVAGFMQRRNVSVAKFYSWLDIILDEGSDGFLFFSRGSGSGYVPEYKDPLDRSSPCVLRTGDYLLLNADGSPCTVALSARTYLPRLRTQNATPNLESRDFTSRIVGRDMQCCMSGTRILLVDKPNPLFQAAHLYPTAWRESWLNNGYDTLAGDDSTFGTMNSSSNGLTMTAEYHLLFCYYNITVDPENFLLMDFTQPGTLYRPMLGRLILDNYNGDVSLLRCLLREHYENSILLNVRGYGIFGDPHSAKVQDMIMSGRGNIRLDNPVFQSGIEKQFLETTLATRLYTRLEGVEPWPRTDDKGKYDTNSQCFTHTPTPIDSPPLHRKHETLLILRQVYREVSIQDHYDRRPFEPLWQ